MAIEDRNLPAGTRLEATYKKSRYVCTVEADEGGKLAFVLEDGKRYKSPSSAASAVMGGSAANGWRFWSPEGTAASTPPARPRTRANSGNSTTESARKPRSQSKAAHKMIQPTENQEDVPEGQGRWWCDACMESFLVFAGKEPTQCPNGHHVDDPELTATTAAGAVAIE